MTQSNKIIFKILNKGAEFLGRTHYRLDKDIGTTDLFEIVFERALCYLRFLWVKPFLGSSHLIGFVGRSVRLVSKRKLMIGRSFYIGDFCSLNLLCRTQVQIGDNFVLKDHSIIDCTGVYTDIGSGLTIGDNVGISQGCFIQVRGNVSIGDDVIMGPGVKIFSENHNFTGTGVQIRLQGVTRSDVIIESNTWIGANAVVLAGVTIGANSVVAAGCVVTKSFPKNSIVGGVPARLISQR
jgi:acetyltransferase-like isoleucine patch superfamily enzyme